MRPHRVEVAPPVFDQHLRFSERVEDLAVEELGANAGIEGLDESVLPRTARNDVRRLRPDGGMIARPPKGAPPAAASMVPPSRPMLDDAAFEAFLHKRRPHPPVFSMSGLDGYLTALIIGPRFIDPRYWIGLIAGKQAMMAPKGTTEALAVQTLAANYNRISAGLAETPRTWRPRLARRKDGTFDTFAWSTAFLLAISYIPRLWRPVLQGHPRTGDIIAPIRDATTRDPRLDEAGVAPIAKVVVVIRAHLMPNRAKAGRS